MRILLLEDDLQLGKALHTALAQHQYSAVWVRRIVDARERLANERFALLLLDLGLPDGCGLELLQELRRPVLGVGGDAQPTSRLPVLLLTARDRVQDRVRGLDAGADDYLVKPFDVAELMSRIRALLRRSAGQAQDEWCLGDLRVLPSRQSAHLGLRALDLSLREYRLLVELARNAGRYVTRASLEDAVIGADWQGDSNMLEVHVHNLRKKLGTQAIRTIRGVGYLLEEQVWAEAQQPEPAP
jgi:two-component system, OmpR family, response regulator QseB